MVKQIWVRWQDLGPLMSGRRFLLLPHWPNPPPHTHTPKSVCLYTVSILESKFRSDCDSLPNSLVLLAFVAKLMLGKRQLPRL